jgi:hypothetical protein
MQNGRLCAVHFALLERRIRTPELNFSAEKFSEAVPRAHASDGEYATRGRILPPLHLFDADFPCYTTYMLVSVIVILILLAAIYLLARPVIRGAIFFPTTRRNVEVMLDMASLRQGARIADLGSGDGRILIACARRGMRAEGYEINPILVFRSRWAIQKAGFRNFAVVHWKSFWRADLAPFDAIFVYGIPYIMDGLRNKLERELRPGAKIVSNVFPFPGWEPVEKQEKEKIYLYKIDGGL